MVDVYQVKRGDSPWNFAKVTLERSNSNVTSTDIAHLVAKLPSIYGCKSMEEFQRKYFGKAGNTIEIKFGNKSKNKPNVPAFQRNRDLNHRQRIDSTMPCDAIPDSGRLRSRVYPQNPSDTSVSQKSGAKSSDTDSLQLRKKVATKKWTDIKANQDRINKLSTDKERIIEYNRTIGKIDQNYIIIDKKNYTATVYSPDGKVVKSYEVGVAKNKSDALLRRSYKTKNNQIEATSAGIYTANYRATGRDAYRRLYNNRVLTLSNDGLKERGVGNGETGVALHQVPNGNTLRTQKLRAPGTSDKNNRFSSGCINFLPEDFDNCMKHIAGVGTKVYILPEESNNYISVKNGKLQFTQKNYTGDVATTTTKNNPVKTIRIRSKNSNISQEGLNMASTLSAQKKTLAKELGIDNDTYNNLAMLTLGIAGQESNYGDSTKYWTKENCPWLVNAGKYLTGNDSYNSRGLTQMKIQSYTDPEVKKLFNKYGITSENVNQGNKAAIATMIVLSCMYKNELPALKSKIQAQHLSSEDALLYCWQNRKSEISNGTATPRQSVYHRNVHRFMDNFEIYQTVA